MHARCLNIKNNASIFVFKDLSSLVLAIWLINKLFCCSGIIFYFISIVIMQKIGPLYVLQFVNRRKWHIYQCDIDLNNPLKNLVLLFENKNELPLSWFNSYFASLRPLIPQIAVIIYHRAALLVFIKRMFLHRLCLFKCNQSEIVQRHYYHFLVMSL